MTTAQNSPRSPRSASPDSAAGFFSFAELDGLNSGYYHDASHSLEVAELTGEMALRLGRSPARAAFLRQVALIHDADPRLCPRSGAVLTGIPARVPVTLSWMEAERPLLERRFGWHGHDFAEAVAMIARTDYPFDQRPRQHGTRFDGASPVEVYHQALLQLPEARRPQCMSDALLLRFADQVAAYTGPFPKALQSVRDLVDELNTAGHACSFETLLRGTASFLKQTGTDMEHDHRLSDAPLHLPLRGELVRGLGWRRRLHLSWNATRFTVGRISGSGQGPIEGAQ